MMFGWWAIPNVAPRGLSRVRLIKNSGVQDDVIATLAWSWCEVESKSLLRLDQKECVSCRLPFGPFPC